VIPAHDEKPCLQRRLSPEARKTLFPEAYQQGDVKIAQDLLILSIPANNVLYKRSVFFDEEAPGFLFSPGYLPAE
jgi:hypothetical protein